MQKNKILRTIGANPRQFNGGIQPVNLNKTPNLIF